MGDSATTRRVRLALYVLSGAALAYVLWPLASPIVWATTLAILFYPLHRSFRARGWGESKAAAAALLVTCLLVIGPLLLVGATALQELQGFVGDGQSLADALRGAVDRTVAGLPDWARKALGSLGLTGSGALQRAIGEKFSANLGAIGAQAVAVGQTMATFIGNLLLAIYLQFFLLRDARRILLALRRSALADAADIETIGADVATVVRATLKGIVAVALVEGALGAAMLWAVGFASPILWGVAMGLTSIVPLVGAALVWAPAALYLLATGSAGAALFVVAVGVGVISMVDNVVRPWVVGGDTGLPDYAVLLVTLGAMAALGFDGLILGPVALSVFVSIWPTPDLAKPPA
ncbi:MAG: AI-2E family transporter [Rhizobiales bacterium]|nr:AI-2E family transporter [Hyphomicrobiales bacterium]